jgi:hypothetical protein
MWFDTALHNTGLDVGSRIIRQANIFQRSIGQSHVQVHMRTREYFPILVADALVALVASAGSD